MGVQHLGSREDIIGFDTESIAKLGLIPQQAWVVAFQQSWEYVIRSYLQFSTNMGAWMMPTISLRWGMQCFFWYHYGFSCCQPYTVGVWLVLKWVLYPKFKASLVANMMTWIMGFYGLWRIRGHFRVQLSWLTLYLRYYLRYPAQTQSLAALAG